MISKRAASATSAVQNRKPVQGELQILKHLVDFASLLGSAMRDLVVLFLYLLTTCIPRKWIRSRLLSAK